MIFKSINDCAIDKLKEFDSGVIELDLFLKCYALKNDKSGYGKTFILEDNNLIIGYFTLCTSHIEYKNLPYINKLPKYPMPAVRIARLAVQKEKQHQGYGKSLIKEAFKLIIEISNKIGIYAVVVDSKDDAISFYKNYGFTKLLNSNSTFYLPIETLKLALK